MRNRIPARKKSLNSTKALSVELSPEDKHKITREAPDLLSQAEIDEISKQVMNEIESTRVSGLVELEISKIGMVPESAPGKGGKEIPEDIPKGAIFASGMMHVPIPVCGKDEKGAKTINWKPFIVDYSFYRKSPMDTAKIIFSLSRYTRTSEFLKPETQRVKERELCLDKMRTGIYGGKISSETLLGGLKHQFETIYQRHAREEVQEIIDRGEFSRIIRAVEQDKELFDGSDLKIDADNEGLDQALFESLKKASGSIGVPSYQSWAGAEAQDGWLRLCNLASYSKDYMQREIDFLKENGDRIAEAVGNPNHVMFFGIGNFEKEMFLLRKILESREEDDETMVHGIDVGTEFHLCALKGMQAIRKETGKNVKYRGHISRFASAPEIADYIHSTHEEEPKVLRACLGNTFGNFSRDENLWEDLAGNMKKGEKLLISADIVQNQGTEEERQAKIQGVLARYQSREWREWVLNPLYRAFGQNHRWLVSPDNVQISWDDTTHGIVFTYTFPEAVDNGQGMRFAKGEVIELHRTRKIEPERLATEAARNGFEIKEQFPNKAGNFGYFILEKL